MSYRELFRAEEGVSGQELTYSPDGAVFKSGYGDMRGEFPLFGGKATGDKPSLDAVAQVDKFL